MNRNLKILSLRAVNTWTMAEMGISRCKKSHKNLIQRKRRTLLKKDTLYECTLE